MREIEQIYRNIGDNVYRFRMMKQMTQEELAELSNVSSAYISQIERANLHRSITLATMINIAKALDAPLCVLMAEETCETYLECLKRIAAKRQSEVLNEKSVKKESSLKNNESSHEQPIETPFDNLIVRDDDPLF